MMQAPAPVHGVARYSYAKMSLGVPPVKVRSIQHKAVSSNAVPSTLSVAETEDACKYAQVAKVAYESSKDLVLQQLHEFATPDGAKPFAKVTADDVILINYSTNLLGWFSRLIPALQTDTEVLFIRVPGSGFDKDRLKAKGDQLIVGFRGTEVAVTEGLMSDLLTDISAVRSNIRSMKGLPPDSLSEAKYDKVMVHSGFLTSFNDLMTGGDKADVGKDGKRKSKEEAEKSLTMDEAAAKLLKGQAPARVVCCGHSLGAALATLGAFWWAKKFPQVEVFCYAFASPRVGNEEFCSDFLERGDSVAEGQVDKAFRFTHKGDLVPAVPPPWLFGYSHIEKSVFLLEPKEQTWGVPDADKVALPEGQTYLALLTQRPIDYLTYRALNPIVSTKASYHDMGAHIRGLRNILEYSRATVTATSR